MSVTGLAGMYNIKKLVPDLHPPDEVYAGIPAPFHLTVQNSKRLLPSFLIRLEYGSGLFVVIPIVHANSTHDSTVLLFFEQRGMADLGTITISSPYPVGFFTRYWRFAINDSVLVFPHPLATESSGSGDESPAHGSKLHRDRGIHGELERISPYSGAEPLRMIHWKHSARSNDLLVKGFGRSMAAPLEINLDALTGQNVEERLSRAAWLVQQWVRERPVGVVLGSRVIQSEIGIQHGLMLLRELALYDGN
jgi:uncharacterized protein (DUF58 family)